MGAWGAGVFENDSALDWLMELEGERTLRPLERSVGWAFGPAGRYVDVDAGCVCLAACEILANLAGQSGPTALPDPALSYCARVKTAPSKDLLQRALSAVEVMAYGENSELALLWTDAGDEAFEQAVEELRARLMAAAA